MKRLKPWQKNAIVFCVVWAVIAGVAVFSYISGDFEGYKLMSEKQFEKEIASAYERGKISASASTEISEKISEELETSRKEWYDIGYGEGYADGLEEGKSQAEETKAEPSTSSEQETSSSSDQTSSTSSKSEQQTITVYITDYGSKYHRQGCQYLWDSSNAVTLSNAKSWGYSPCSVCDPPA